MTEMSVNEKIMYDYIDEESNELLLEVAQRVAADGYEKLMTDDRTGAEVLAFKILSQAMIKQLALMTEKIDHPNLAMAYIQVAPMHATYVQELLIQGMKQKAAG